ncbi:hypothetical protein, partial [Agrobacterium salinitolerans]|uniref:hypothetical protein n=1 Tax=Agrobacterium salinitolerans TaxID=1183413 RepID=UPI001AEDDBD3
SPIQHRKRPQQNVIIPKKKKPAENIDGFVSGLKGPKGPFFVIAVATIRLLRNPLQHAAQCFFQSP